MPLYDYQKKYTESDGVAMRQRAKLHSVFACVCGILLTAFVLRIGNGTAELWHTVFAVILAPVGLLHAYRAYVLFNKNEPV